MRKFKRICALFLAAGALTANALALGAEIRQMPITGDTPASEFMNGLNWLDSSKNGFQSKKFAKIVETVSDDYYFGITYDALYDTVTNGSLIRLPQNNIDFIYTLMFQALDKFSYYVPPVINSPFDDPHYTGFGVVIYDTKRNKYTALGEGLYIEEVYADSPADKAGIQPHDKIIAVDGVKVENLSLNALTTLLSSYKDEDQCTLTLKRGDELLDFGLLKEEIPSSELMTTFFPQYSTAKFDISAFSSSTLSTLFEQALKETSEAGYKYLIIDLRDNPGGVVDYAMKTTDLLITEEHSLFTFKAKGDVPFMDYTSDAAGYTFDKIIIMVNANTASAAEAMTISLKSLSDAIIVGTKTYGKEIGQVIHALEDNSYFAVTTIKGYGPKGEDYNTIGIEPDHTVDNKTVLFALPDGYKPLTAEQLETIRDGGDSDAILALEQRFNLLNHLPDKYVDGVYDENLDACIKILQINQGVEFGTLQPELLTYLDKTIEGYLGSASQPEDNQLDFVMDMIKAEIAAQR